MGHCAMITGSRIISMIAPMPYAISLFKLTQIRQYSGDFIFLHKFAAWVYNLYGIFFAFPSHCEFEIQYIPVYTNSPIEG
jgi:hypothetical protein